MKEKKELKKTEGKNMSEEDKGLLDKINESLVETVNETFSKIFGEKSKEFFEKSQEHANELVKLSTKMGMSIADTIAEKLEIKENENVKKARETIKDALVTVGILEEGEEI